MKLKELIKIADSHYPDHLIIECFNEKRQRPKKRGHSDLGDGLALFICEELCDTFDPKASDNEQTHEARRVMQTAVKELQAVANAF